MLDALKRSAEAAVELAKAAGADEVVASSRRNREVEFRLRNGELEKAKESTTRSLNISLYVNGRYSSNSTTDLREDRLRAFVEETIALTGALEPDPSRQITDPSLYEGRSEADLQLADPQLQSLTPESRLETIQSIYATAEGHDGLISVGGISWDDHTMGAMATSNGFSGTWENTSYWLGCEITARDEGDKRQRGGMYAGGHHFNSPLKPEELGAQALKWTMDRLGSVQGPTARTTMIVHPRAAARMIAYLLSPANARAIQQKRSFWDGLLGEKVFSDKLTIVDDPLLVGGLNSRHFDGEGISAKPLTLVDGGVAQNLYIDTYYGRKLGMAPTTGSGSNRIVMPGAHNLDEILAGTDHAILVTGWLGGNSDATTGDFSLGCQGHEVKKGVVGGPIGEMNVTGNLVDLFANLTDVGNDPWKYSSTLTPTLVFKDVQFSGA